MLRAGRTRRIRTTGPGVVALAAAALSLVAVPGAALAGGGAAPPPPAQNPQVTEVDGMWGASLFSAQDKPDCPGRIASSAATGFEVFRESRETWRTDFASSSDPRYDGSITFYLHILRDVTAQGRGPIGEVDGTYAVFDGSGRAIAHGNIQGVLVRETSTQNGTETATAQGTYGISNLGGLVRLQGLLFGGQVLFPSGATIGRPYLLANYLASFREDPLDPNDHFKQFIGTYGEEQEESTEDIVEAVAAGNGSVFEQSYPAIVVGGSCPGSYRNRTTSAPVAQTAKTKRARAQAAFVRKLYEDVR